MKKLSPLKLATLGLGCAALCMATIAVSADHGRGGRSKVILFDGNFGTTGGAGCDGDAGCLS